MTEAWETSYQAPIIDPATGNQLSFMNNWSRLAKASTAFVGNEFDVNTDGDITTSFNLGTGEDADIFHLTYSNTNVTSVLMTLQLPDGATLDVNAGPLPYGYTNEPGSYGEVDLDRQEAFFLIPHPMAGQYTVTVLNPDDLGDYAVEDLSQNLARL